MKDTLANKQEEQLLTYNTPGEAPFHSVTWVVWLGATLVAIIITRNPLYLVLLLLNLFVVFAALQGSTAIQGRPSIMSPFSFTVIVTLITGLFNMLTVHYGDTTLFRLPAVLPLVGGNMTAEALAFGVVNGLSISALFTAFTVLNMALPIRAVIRFIPRAFYPLAVVTSIAVTFVPTTLRQFQHIREAQAVRGHTVRGLRDWLPLFMPLLIGGLERAFQLAEAMTARGFASTNEYAYHTRNRTAIVLGLVAFLCGWLLHMVWGYTILGMLCMGIGALLIGGVLWAISRHTPHTVYRREWWSCQDAIIIVGAVVVVLLFVLNIPGIDRSTLFYYTYPTLTLPRFDPWVGLSVLGLLMPALLVRQKSI